MSDTLMTDTATTTTEGQATSQTATSEAAQATPAATEQVATTQQATEGQNTEANADGAKAEGEQAKAEEKPAAPEKYEFKAPEGKEFDPAVIEPFSELAKELDLPQEAAQKILDKMGPLLETRQVQALEAARTEWANTSQSDKEFGGEKLTENLSVAKKALDSFGTPELRELLNKSGLGNHPEVIRFMYRTGKAISEDRFVGGSVGQPSATRDAANALYPSQQSK